MPAMETDSKLLQCYNPNCNKQFREEENGPVACCFHSKPPVFRNGGKVWECCNRQSWDWTEFVAIKEFYFERPLFCSNDTALSSLMFEVMNVSLLGCTRGYHSKEKPFPVQPSYSAPSPMRIISDETHANLETSSPKIEEKPLLFLTQTTPLITEDGRHSCMNIGCHALYYPEENSSTACVYHTGKPIFRDTKKLWSCCQASSYEWDQFLQIVPCTTGFHKPKREPLTVQK
ncbi:CHORD protein [Cardiosporidium cionae]|uniref:CHORD protein n=1 Tax=Cardiosporidium cionae TaxID=476202 RepID=A0ABQ7JDZ0_9APIC|nr:CHORD protein [Cardiosporidium cionae]|eukprot:KAF8822168.1 CHORD protein [Cardiosporidium cionae]